MGTDLEPSFSETREICVQHPFASDVMFLPWHRPCDYTSWQASGHPKALVTSPAQSVPLQYERTMVICAFCGRVISTR